LEKVKKSNEQSGGAKKKSKSTKAKKSKSTEAKKKDPYDDEDEDSVLSEFLNSDSPKQKHYSSPYSQPFAPIHQYYYDPYLYGMNMNSFYIPTFYSYVNPFIKINFHPA
jgi:hypothetical protein